MKVYKITYKEKDHAGIWRKKFSLRYANTEDEAVSQIDAHHSMIMQVEFLGYRVEKKSKDSEKQHVQDDFYKK
jgi:hypothetical protein